MTPKKLTRGAKVEKQATISFKIDETEHATIKDFCKEHGFNIRGLIIAAVKKFISSYNGGNK
jgi:NRPS condensation-like uncharacterized protein